MPSSAGPNTAGESNLVFAYDTGDVINSYKGEPTTNYITTMAANLGGNVSLSYPLNVYICTAQETNVVDPTAPGGQYSRFTGNTDSDNNQLFTAFVDGGVNARNTTVAYSVYLKGSGTCHLTVYSDIAGYNITSTITLTSQWTRYSIVQAVGNYTTYAWAAVRGILTTTNVYVAAQQIEFKTHITPFINGTRSITQGLVSLLAPNAIDLTDVSFDSAAQITYDGTNDKIHGIDSIVSYLSSSAIEFVVTPTVANKRMTVGGYRQNDGYSQPTIGMVYIQNDNTFNAQVITATQVYRGVTSTTTIAANKTYHVVFNKDTSAGVMQLYVNGVLEASQTFDAATYGQWTTAGSYIGSNILDLGKSYNTNAGQGWSGDYLAGKIPIFKLYSTTLAPSQVAQNYQAYKSRFNLA